jgi:hypothetical protein
VVAHSLSPSKLYINAGSPAGHNSTEANTLKYVCHQIHEETQKLSLKFNDLTFYYTDSISALSACETFLTTIVALKYHFLIKKVNVIERSWESLPITSLGKLRKVMSGRTFPAIHALCVRQPTTLIVLRLNIPQLNWDTCLRFVVRHATFSLTLRGHPGVSLLQDEASLALVNEDDHFTAIRVDQLKRFVEGQIPENFRFCLMNDLAQTIERHDQWAELIRNITEKGC